MTLNLTLLFFQYIFFLIEEVFFHRQVVVLFQGAGCVICGLVKDFVWVAASRDQLGYLRRARTPYQTKSTRRCTCFDKTKSFPLD